MNPIDRREFIGKSSKTIVALSAGTAVMGRTKRAVSANEKIRMALIGVGGRGTSLIQGFAKWPEVDVTYLCDCNPRRGGIQDLADQLEREKNLRPKIVTDHNEVFRDKDVDAVVIATPDHWHAPLAIFACQHEKDVYVEKPPTHNIWEGRKMVEAARKYKRIVQCGTQNRSAPYNWKAKEYIESGKLGTIHLCKVFNMKGGGPYHKGPDGTPPPDFDWDRWLGPAPMRPYNESVHHGWHMYWDFTADDLADDGSHQLDLARWLIGKDYPKSVYSVGGKYPFNDDRDPPVVLETSYEFDDMVMTMELTQYTPYMSKIAWEIRESDLFPYWPQCATRIELYGTKNQMLVGRHGGGWQVFTSDGKVVDQEYGRFPDDPHKQNFLDCIRSRKLPNADAEEGHRSACLIHLATVSYRVGCKKLNFDAKTETFDDAEANQLVKRTFREPYVVPDEV